VWFHHRLSRVGLSCRHRCPLWMRSERRLRCPTALRPVRRSWGPRWEGRLAGQCVFPRRSPPVGWPPLLGPGSPDRVVSKKKSDSEAGSPSPLGGRPLWYLCPRAGRAKRCAWLRAQRHRALNWSGERSMPGAGGRPAPPRREAVPRPGGRCPMPGGPLVQPVFLRWLLPHGPVDLAGSSTRRRLQTRLLPRATVSRPRDPAALLLRHRPPPSWTRSRPAPRLSLRRRMAGEARRAGRVRAGWEGGRARRTSRSAYLGP